MNTVVPVCLTFSSRITSGLWTSLKFSIVRLPFQTVSSQYLAEPRLIFHCSIRLIERRVVNRVNSSGGSSSAVPYGRSTNHFIHPVRLCWPREGWGNGLCGCLGSTSIIRRRRSPCRLYSSALGQGVRGGGAPATCAGDSGGLAAYRHERSNGGFSGSSGRLAGSASGSEKRRVPGKRVGGNPLQGTKNQYLVSPMLPSEIHHKASSEQVRLLRYASGGCDQ
jgi:hypothetical protein